MNIKKNIIMVIAALASMALFGTDGFSFVTDIFGYSYLQIDKDFDAFSFKSDFKSIGNSGKVGYVIYDEGMSVFERAKYIRQQAGNAEFAKSINDGKIDLGALKAGDRVGFYLERNNGDVIYETGFYNWHGKTYLEFDKNFSLFSKDEWMSLSDIHAVEHLPAGAPVPGIFVIMLVGGIGLSALKRNHRAVNA